VTRPQDPASYTHLSFIFRLKHAPWCDQGSSDNVISSHSSVIICSPLHRESPTLLTCSPLFPGAQVWRHWPPSGPAPRTPAWREAGGTAGRPPPPPPPRTASAPVCCGWDRGRPLVSATTAVGESGAARTRTSEVTQGVLWPGVNCGGRGDLFEGIVCL
jgi:hypothetical protein